MTGLLSHRDEPGTLEQALEGTKARLRSLPGKSDDEIEELIRLTEELATFELGRFLQKTRDVPTEVGPSYHGVCTANAFLYLRSG